MSSKRFYLEKARFLSRILILFVSVLSFSYFLVEKVHAQGADGYLPTYGKVSTYTENGKRVIYHSMVWTQDRIDYIQSLEGSITYEHSFIMNRNSDSEHGRETWAAWEPGLDGIPNRLSAESNLPEWYVDTASIALGLGNFAEYTFGTADAKLLVADKVYWSKMVLELGDDLDCRLDDSVVCERAQLSGDLGYHWTSCSGPITPPWCIDDDLHYPLTTKKYEDSIGRKTNWVIAVPQRNVEWGDWPTTETPTPNPDPTDPNEPPTPVRTPYPPTDDTTPPTLSGYNPNISGGVAYLSVSGASDVGSGVKEVRYSAKWNGNWAGIGVSSTYPYNINWDMCAFGVPNGDIEFGVEIWDHANNKWIWSQHYSNPHASKQHDCATQPVVTPSACEPLLKVQLVSPENGKVYSSDNDWANFPYDWNGVVNATHYEIEVAYDSGFNSVFFDHRYRSVTETIGLHAELGTYYWRVRAQNYEYGCAESGPWSDVWKVEVQKNTYSCYAVPDLGDPSYTIGLAHNANCESFSHLTWQKPGVLDSRGRNIMSSIWLTKGLSVTIYDNETGEGPSKCFMGHVENLAGYTYDGTNISTDDSFEAFRLSKVPCYSPPFEPQNFRLGHIDDDSITLWWDYNIDGVSGYHVYKWDPEQYWVLIGDLDKGSQDFWHQGLTCGETHTYMLAAYNQYGESRWAGTLSGSTWACDRMVPNAPVLYAADAGADYHKLFWEHDPGSTGNKKPQSFKIYKEGSSTAWELLATVSAETTTYYVRELECGTSVTYVVTAAGFQGESAYSNTVTATTTPCLSLHPDDLRQAEKTFSSARIEWSSTGADEYRLYKYVTVGGEDLWQEVTRISGTQHSYELTNLLCNFSGYFALSAVFDGTETDRGPWITVETRFCSDLPAPVLLTPLVSVVWGNDFDLKWNAVEQIAFYRIEIKDSSGKSVYWQDEDTVGDFHFGSAYVESVGIYQWRVWGIIEDMYSTHFSEWGVLTITDAVVESENTIFLPLVSR